jgi:6-pyruvoyl-tetrahydropterin synthase
VIDFGEVKTAIRALCDELDERFLCPGMCKFLQVEKTSTQVNITTKHSEVESFFSFPIDDIIILPIIGTTVEELARYLAEKLISRLGADRLRDRKVISVTVGVAETASQEARYTLTLQ